MSLVYHIGEGETEQTAIRRGISIQSIAAGMEQFQVKVIHCIHTVNICA